MLRNYYSPELKFEKQSFILIPVQILHVPSTFTQKVVDSNEELPILYYYY